MHKKTKKKEYSWRSGAGEKSKKNMEKGAPKRSGTVEESTKNKKAKRRTKESRNSRESTKYMCRVRAALDHIRRYSHRLLKLSCF